MADPSGPIRDVPNDVRRAAARENAHQVLWKPKEIDGRVGALALQHIHQASVEVPFLDEAVAGVGGLRREQERIAMGRPMKSSAAGVNASAFHDKNT